MDTLDTPSHGQFNHLIKLSRTASAVITGILLGFACPASITAYDLPPLNLGFTSFLDGGPPAGPGLYYAQYVQYYESDDLKDADGDSLLPFDHDLDVWVSLSQLIYQSDQELLFGGKWGADLIIPVVGLDFDPEIPGMLEHSGTGLGDILIGPYLQWDPIMGENGPIFMHRIEAQFLLPTGEYKDDRELTPGSGYFSINPYWAATLFLTPQWTTSTRVHYLWNAKNDDPRRGSGALDDTQAGQAVHLNFAMAYELWPKRLRAGLNGYYLKQITNDEIDGTDAPNTKEQVLGIGPGAVFHFSETDHLFFNVYFETETENRPEGTRFNLRYVHRF